MPLWLSFSVFLLQLTLIWDVCILFTEMYKSLQKRNAIEEIEFIDVNGTQLCKTYCGSFLSHMWALIKKINPCLASLTSFGTHVCSLQKRACHEVTTYFALTWNSIFLSYLNYPVQNHWYPLYTIPLHFSTNACFINSLG